ncbi:MAG TPA: iron-containing alcohol dehydrogenase [Mobilitalea sp.]|nr:iron-containing alcohol dehydrogenase [Mobilitalea sp.]
MFRVYCRMYQIALKAASPLLPWRKPIVIKGRNSLMQLPGLLNLRGIHQVLIVTDRGIMKIGLMEGLLQGLKKERINVTIYDKTVPNPTIDNIEEALRVYRKCHCSAIIGFGGGTAIDCAKGVGARVARPEKLLPQMKGILKVRRRMPTLFAVPTTAGSGSEATIASVVTDRNTHEKYAINDMSLIPNYAILDPMLTVSMPGFITATTGMDALTHAIEAYIGRSNTAETRFYSRRAVSLIFKNLWKAYSDGSNINARDRMLRASYYAGVAFTRAYVGNVHAIAHTLGGFYSIPHGLANAVILPYVLEYYGYTVYKPLSELADLVGIGDADDSIAKKAVMFIKEIKRMNERMGIPDKIKGIDERDIPLMAHRAFHEANPLYPVPKIFNISEFRLMYYLIKE